MAKEFSVENLDEILDDLFDVDISEIEDGTFDYGDFLIAENMGAFDEPEDEEEENTLTNFGDKRHCFGCERTGVTKRGKICSCEHGARKSLELLKKESQRYIEEKARRKAVTYWNNVPGAENFRGISR